MGIYYQDDNIEIRVYSDEEIQKEQESRDKYKQSAKTRHAETSRKWVKKKFQTDPLYKMRHNLRCLIRTSMKNNGFSKKTKTYNILGCSYTEFKEHIEQKFTNGMSWENYGKWEYDHITPVSWAMSESEIVLLNHYTNIQPLWRTDNILKSNKFSG